MQNKITFAGAIKKTFVSWRDYKGVSSRREYWFFYLFMLLLIMVTQTVDGIISRGNVGNPFITMSVLTSVLLTVVRLPLLARRFHDAGLSAWLLLVVLVPLVVFFLEIPAIVELLQNPVFQTPSVSKLSDAQLQKLGLQMLNAFGWIFLATLLVGTFDLVVTLLPSKPSWRGNRFAPITEPEPEAVWGYQQVWGQYVNGKFIPAQNQPPQEEPKNDDHSI